MLETAENFSSIFFFFCCCKNTTKNACLLPSFVADITWKGRAVSVATTPGASAWKDCGFRYRWTTFAFICSVNGICHIATSRAQFTAKQQTRIDDSLAEQFDVDKTCLHTTRCSEHKHLKWANRYLLSGSFCPFFGTSFSCQETISTEVETTWHVRTSTYQMNGCKLRETIT